MNITLIKSSIKQSINIIRQYLSSLPYPLESFMEDEVMGSSISIIMINDMEAGFVAHNNSLLILFYVNRDYKRYAPIIFEEIITMLSITEIYSLTHDYHINTLMAEWSFTVIKEGCCFCDITNEVSKTQELRYATHNDIEIIRVVSEDFFDEVSGGYNNIEERIDDNTIFILEEEESVKGIGVIERSRINEDYISIGMFTNPNYREQGVAKRVLLSLKKYVYDTGKKPIAGCWYYNTLSRKSLESAGLGVCFIIQKLELISKDKLPLRSGNPS